MKERLEPEKLVETEGETQELEKRVPPPLDLLELPPAEPDLEIQNNIISLFRHWPSDGKDELLKRLASGQIPQGAIRTFLLNFPRKIERKEKDRVKGFFAAALSPGETPEKVAASRIINVIDDHYGLGTRGAERMLEEVPEPATFEDETPALFGDLIAPALPKMREKYLQGISRFMVGFYGERGHYWEQLKLLQREADRKHPELSQMREAEGIQGEVDLQKLKTRLEWEILAAFESLKLRKIEFNQGDALPLGFVAPGAMERRDYKAARDARPFLPLLLKRIAELEGVETAAVLGWAEAKAFKHRFDWGDIDERGIRNLREAVKPQAAQEKKLEEPVRSEALERAMAFDKLMDEPQKENKPPPPLIERDLLQLVEMTLGEEAHDTHPVPRAMREAIFEERNLDLLETQLRERLRTFLEKKGESLRQASPEGTIPEGGIFGEDPLNIMLAGRIGKLQGQNGRGVLRRFQGEAFRDYIGLHEEEAIKVMVDVEPVERKEWEPILSRAEIHGSPFDGKVLTASHLALEHLEPKHKIRVGRTSIYFSSPYELRHGRLGVVAYVEYRGRVVARSYYRSNSHGVWRYLPGYTFDENRRIGERIRWYAKGRRSEKNGKKNGEIDGSKQESANLPATLQSALAHITHEGMPVLKAETMQDPEFVFAGTCRPSELNVTPFGSGEETLVWIKHEVAEAATVNHEVNAIPKRLRGNFYDGRLAMAPEEIGFYDDREAPDFSQLKGRWKQISEIYGPMTVEIIPSKNGELLYVFCRAGKGEEEVAWIGGGEVIQDLQSIGLPRDWVDLGLLGTPAAQYEDEVPFPNPGAKRKGQYVDTYKNFLSRIPVIKEYMASVKNRKNGGNGRNGAKTPN